MQLLNYPYEPSHSKKGSFILSNSIMGVSASKRINEQFRNCVNRANFNNDNDIEQVMSVIVSDVDNHIDISYTWEYSNRNIIIKASYYNKIEQLKLVLSKYKAILSKIIDDCDI